MFRSFYFVCASIFLCLSASIHVNASDHSFSFDDHDFLEGAPLALVPTKVFLKFEQTRVIDNSYGYYIGIHLLSDENEQPELKHIGFMDGEVIAGQCPSRCSDGIYEKHGKHIRLAHFKINPSFQGQGLGLFAFTQFFRMFDMLGLPCKLEVSLSNPRAGYIFKKFGFKRVVDVEECHFAGIESLMKPAKRGGSLGLLRQATIHVTPGKAFNINRLMLGQCFHMPDEKAYLQVREVKTNVPAHVEYDYAVSLWIKNTENSQTVGSVGLSLRRPGYGVVSGSLYVGIIDIYDGRHERNTSNISNQNRGFGTSAMRTLVELFRLVEGLKFNRFMLDVAKSNERAIHVYEKVGFKISPIYNSGSRYYMTLPKKSN